MATDSTTFVGETRSWRRRIEDPPVSWCEDLHWWYTLVGNAAYECEDFESSSLAVLDVLADGISPMSVHALTVAEKRLRARMDTRRAGGISPPTRQRMPRWSPTSPTGTRSCGSRRWRRRTRPR